VQSLPLLLDYIYSMRRIRPDVDIINDLLEAVALARPADAFVKSLHLQYQERGGLSKKQLQGLYGKASRIEGIPPGKLATLEAIILKRPTREKSSLPAAIPAYKPDEESGKIIKAILEKYPEHKRVLFFKSKFDNDEPLNQAELSELQRFEKLLKISS
jgi:hypothetical protein